MKKFFLIAVMVLSFLPVHSLAQEYSNIPGCFYISYKPEERKTNNDMSFVSKEHVSTTQELVNNEVNGVVDRFDEEMSPLLTPDKTKRPRRNSRLDIHVVHSISGRSAMSFLVLSRETYQRKQNRSPFWSCVYDMTDGHKIFLQDVLVDQEATWERLRSILEKELSARYSNSEIDQEALSALLNADAIKDVAYALNIASIDFFFQANTLYKDQPTIIKISVPYKEISNLLTDYGKTQTDNSMYKAVALTFDDGPSYENTPKVLDSLREHGAKATFFLVGSRIGEYPDIVMRENDEGHSLQSHHFYHIDASKSTVELIKKGTSKFEQALMEVTRTKPIMLRAPYGKFKPFAKAKVNLPLIGWDVDTKDWTGKSASAVLSVVKKSVKPGSIILMHDIKNKTPASAEAVLDWLTQHDYLCVSVEDLFLHQGMVMEPNKVYHSAIPR